MFIIIFKKIFDIYADNFFGGIRFFKTFIMYNYRLQKQDLSMILIENICYLHIYDYGVLFLIKMTYL